MPQWTMLDQMMSSKEVIGTLYGAAAVPRDMPMLVRLAETGKLDVGAMVSSRITLDQVNDGLQAIERGQVIRSVIVN